METKSNSNEEKYSHSANLQQILDKVFAEAKNKLPYFPYPTPFRKLKYDGDSLKEIIKFKNESLDDLLGTVGFNITHGYLGKYFNDIEHFEIDEMLENLGFDISKILEMINNVGKLISDNTDKQIYIKNRILEILDTCNEASGLGLIVQVLFLQGLLEWFEGCDLNDGDPGSEEAQDLCNWIYNRFLEACTYYFMILQKNDTTQPLTNYLNTMEVGIVWNELEQKKTLPQENDSQNKGNTETEFIIKSVYCLLLFEKYHDLFPDETEDTWLNRFKDNSEKLTPLNLGNHIAEIAGILGALYDGNKNTGKNPEHFGIYVENRWGIKNISKKKGEQKDKPEYNEVFKFTSRLLTGKK